MGKRLQLYEQNLRIRDRFSDYFHFLGHNTLLRKWIRKMNGKIVLITDVFNIENSSFTLYNILPEKCLRFIGLDISPNLVKKAKIQLRSKKVFFIVSDVRNIPLKDKVVDIIISPSTLDHFNENHFAQSVCELNRILKKNGTMILTLNNKYNIFLHFYILKWIKRYQFKLALFSNHFIREVIRKNNLKVRDFKYICHVPFPLIFPFFIKWWYSFFPHSTLIKKLNNLEKFQNSVIGILTGKFVALKLQKI